MELSTKTKKSIKRGELLRVFWWLPIAFVLYIWSMIFMIYALVHFVQILATEKRDKNIQEQLGYFLKYQWQWTLYTLWLDDTLPKWNPFEFIEECKKPAKKK